MLIAEKPLFRMSDRTERLAERLEQIGEDIDELAFDLLRAAASTGVRPEEDKVLLQARRAVTKAAAVLRSLDGQREL